ncbi:MAG TPA: choice-of-anchor tandem repeat GloVer-containing protein [Candidatus Baltobacteraceae bacterium]|jgi:uncharacterized repeat protein (TIGR03803 family)
MKTSATDRCAIAFCAATALLAGCGETRATTNVSGELPQAPAAAAARAIANATLPAPSFKVLHRFTHSDGAYPDGNLVNVNDVLYGTTWAGGLGCSGGCGTVYSITAAGTTNVLHSFRGSPDGVAPSGGLINVNGTFYGTTQGGGSSNKGTVYSIRLSDKEKVLYSFTGGADGATPTAGLVNVNGTLYGTTSGGGSSDKGTVYSISTTGAEKVLHTFTGGSDGFDPEAGLIYVKGVLYGTTRSGGAFTCYSSGDSCGTVYSISTAGAEKVLHSFNGPDGYGPLASLTNLNGTLFGTTSSGGDGWSAKRGWTGCGTVFSMTTTGVEKVLHSFHAGSGCFPTVALVDVEGTLYGTTDMGSGYGVAYSVKTGGAFEVLHRFTLKSNGVYPKTPWSR